MRSLWLDLRVRLYRWWKRPTVWLVFSMNEHSNNPILRSVCTKRWLVKRHLKMCRNEYGTLKAWAEPVETNHFYAELMVL